MGEWETYTETEKRKLCKNIVGFYPTHAPLFVGCVGAKPHIKLGEVHQVKI